MRLMITTLLALGMLAVSAGSASAVSIYIDPADQPGVLQVSDTFSVRIVIESQGDNIQVIGTSLAWNPFVLRLENIVGGPCNANITCATGPTLFSGYNGLNLTRIASPGDNVVPEDPNFGVIRFSGHFGAGGIESPYPSYFPPSNRIATLGYAVFHAIGNGISDITPLKLGGDSISGIVGTLQGVELDTTFTSLTVTVPEPAFALLVCLGLGGLALAGRKLS